MSQAWAETAVHFVIAYSAVGVLFAAVFLVRGVAKIDPSADGSGWGFRLMILPGVAALWPAMLRRWLQSTSQPPTEVTAHRRASQ